MEDDICVNFIIPQNYQDKSECSLVMNQAAEACTKNKVNIKWIKEDDLSGTQFNKTDYVIVEDFKGASYESLKNYKSVRVLGPWCLLVCLMEGKSIPKFDWSILNVAMYDCVVTCSVLPKTVKNAIQKKIELMGGTYSHVFYEGTTHLITESVKSEKYAAAATRNIKIMLPTWVDAVWESSQNANVHSDNRDFEKFKCPPFHKLKICSTGINKERNEMIKLISEHGGIYSGQLDMKTIDVLICPEKMEAYSEKYKAVQMRNSIPCVTLNWLKQSASKGYCLPFADFTVKRSASTPIKNAANPDFSIMSNVNSSVMLNNSVFEETGLPSKLQNTNVNAGLETPKLKNKNVGDDSSLTPEEISILKKLDLKKVKKAGHFLDGCCVYLVGFSGDNREKICKVINVSGATRCDEMSDRVTHVILSGNSSHEEKIIKNKQYSCAFVKLKWILDSMENGQPLNEEGFETVVKEDLKKLASPSGKKGLNLLRSNSTITEVDFNLSQQQKSNERQESIDIDEEKKIMASYLMTENKTTQQSEESLDQLMKIAANEFDSNAFPTVANSSTQLSSTTTDETGIPNLFEKKSFCLQGFDDDEYEQVKNKIEIAKGSVTMDPKKANFIVLMVFIDEEDNRFSSAKTINDIWIYECIDKGEIMQFEYYHIPTVVKNRTVLSDCVVTISGFNNFERNYLKALIQEMGGIPQDFFCRVAYPNKGILGSTHLVTADLSGKKYQAALKWKKPIVHKLWLLNCASAGEKLPEDDFSPDAIDFDEELPTFNTLQNNPIFNDYASNEGTIKSDQTSAINESEIRKTNEVVAELANKPNQEYYKLVYGESTSNSNLQSQNENANTFEQSMASNNTSLRNNVGAPSTSYQSPAPSQGTQNVCSPVTPINKIMKKFKYTNVLGTPCATPPVPTRKPDIKTPITPYEAILVDNPSKELRKNIFRLINSFPDFEPPKRRKSTPLSELVRKLRHKIEKNNEEYFNPSPKKLKFDDNIENEAGNVSEKEDEETAKENTQPTLITTKLQHLEKVLSTSDTNNSRRKSRCFQPVDSDPATEMVVPDSQPFTVQWDMTNTQENQESQEQTKLFLISGMHSEDKAKLMGQLESLGGIVLDCPTYDPTATHLICNKPGKNEKTLAMMAAGKWILHSNYVEASLGAKKFLNEEDYEFGNPKSMGNFSIELDKEVQDRMHAIYFWRKEVAHGNKPFADIRAIIVAERRAAFVKIIEAGGGSVVDADPPFKEYVNATHCLIEPQKVADAHASYIPLARQGIYCVSTLFVSEYLHRTITDMMNSILPQYRIYYN